MNKIDVVKGLFEKNAIHDFSEKEFLRFCGEVASEINKADESGLSEMAKSSTLDAKGNLTIALKPLKVKRDNLTLRGIAWHACMNNAMLLAKSPAKCEVRVDISDICARLREAWTRKDEAAAKAAAAAAQAAAQAAAPAPEPVQA